MTTVRCCESCVQFIGRNDAGVPICGASINWQQRQMVDHALQATNAKNTCTLFVLNARAADDEGGINEPNNWRKEP